MTNKMWGGRFQSGPDAIMEEINASICARGLDFFFSVLMRRVSRTE